MIFGDYGNVTQLVADPNQPSPLLQKIQTTGYIRDIATLRPEHGGNDTIHGNTGRDRIFGGNGNDFITGDGEPNTIFGDHGHMQYLDRHDRRDRAPPASRASPSRRAASTTSRRNGGTTSSSAASAAT